ncbi:MAG: diguanylate cyclase [Gaiellaceae bacterium]|jgi:diguanylate cyclase (GGDEF)-like protein
MYANGSQFDVHREDQHREPFVALGPAFLLALVYGFSFWLPRNGALLREIVVPVTLVLAGGYALLAARRCSGQTLAVYRATAVVCLILAMAEGVRPLARQGGLGTSSQWLLGGSIELAAYSLLLLAALRTLAGGLPVAWSLAVLDTAMVSLALCAPWLVLLVFPRLGDNGNNYLLPELVAPVLAAVVFVTITLAVHAASLVPAWVYLLMAAVTVGLVGDLLAARHLIGTGSTTAALDGWEGRALLLFLVAIFAGEAARAIRRRRLSQGALRIAVVMIAFVMTLTSAAFFFRRGDQLAGFLVASVVSILLLFRLLVHAFDRYRHSEHLEQALREQEQLAVMDSLTGLYNRRFLDAELQLELDRGLRSQEPVGVLLCDLDHFKEVNDNHGHLIGDSVLREVARRLLRAVRNGDLVARYGGEEFVVLLPGGDKEQIREIGERCRRAFDEAPFYLPDGHKTNVTISIGGACWPDDANSSRGLFEAADAALYLAKEGGRNRIRVAEAGDVVPARTGGMLTPKDETDRQLFEAQLGPSNGSRGTYVRAAEKEDESASESVAKDEKMERWAALVARALGLDEEAQRRCALATRFHDIGKNAVPESILLKRGPLSKVEWELMQEHPGRGAAMVELAPELAGAGPIIREHHERFDGRGYPEGKSREEISPEARIVACCDAWSAMRRERAYAPAKSASEARAELLAGRGTQFDPNVVMTFLMFDEGDLDQAENTLAALP